MRTFFVFLLILAWFSPLSGEELAISPDGPRWRMPSVGRAWSYELPAQGGQGPYTWTLVSGSLPPGIHLVDLATVQWGAPSRMGLFGAAAEAGQWPVRLAVTDAEGRTAEASWTLAVSPLVLGKANVVLECGKEAEWHLEVAGAAGAVRVTMGEEAFLPLGMTLSGAGVISGRAALPGRYEVPVEVRDEADRVLRTVVTVAVYGRETALPQLAARVQAEGVEALVAIEKLPEAALMDIDWGDGRREALKETSARHAYEKEGEYEITVLMAQRDGAETAEAKYRIQVGAAGP